MNHNVTDVSDLELHAYVDGELDTHRRLEVEAWLASHPRAAERVREYQVIQEQLHARFDPVLSEVHESPVAPVAQDSAYRFLRVASIATLMLISGLLGWSLNDTPMTQTPSSAFSNLVQPATFAHQVYSNDTRYPVEIPASKQPLLNRWVSLRMHTDLQAPDLTHINLKLLGGRLLPSTNRMAAQFMYEDEQGKRLTIYVRRFADQSGNTDFQYQEQDDLHVFFWVNQSMGYAVVGQQPAANLIAIANAVQSAFTRTR